MVTRRQLHWQGGDGPDALPGWGNVDEPSITAGTIRLLLHQSRARHGVRYLYAMLLLNADMRGYVTVSNDELAHAVDMSLTQTRANLYRLRDMGDIEPLGKGSRWRKSTWRLTRVAELAS